VVDHKVCHCPPRNSVYSCVCVCVCVRVCASVRVQVCVYAYMHISAYEMSMQYFDVVHVCAMIEGVMYAGVRSGFVESKHYCNLTMKTYIKQQTRRCNLITYSVLNMCIHMHVYKDTDH